MKLLMLFLMGFMSLLMSCKSPHQVKEQSLRINIRKEPVSLDPRKGNDMIASQLHFMLFEGLVRLGPDMNISPAQAESYEITVDGKTYTFHLGDNFWSDGTPVTAQDFEKAWKALLDPEFPCPDAYLLYAIKNAKRAKKGQAAADAIGIYARGAKTLVVELEAPSPHFLQIVASSVLLPVNSAADRSHPLWATSDKHFVSNGPFKLARWKFNQEITLIKNRTYRRADEVKLERIDVEMIDWEMAVLHLFKTGHFDLIGTPLSLLPSALRQNQEKKGALTSHPVATTKFLAFNTTTFPFSNANIRRAFALSIDRQAIVTHITQLGETPASTVIPPILTAGEVSPLFADANSALAKECLKRGLEELGIRAKDLQPLTFVYCASEINHLMAQELQNRWAATLGVQVNLEQVEFKTLHEKSKRGDYSIALFAWLADYGDPMNILERFEDATSHRNYPKWQNSSYNLLLEQARGAASREDYLAKIQEAERILVDEMPLTCLFHENYSFMLSPRIRGFAVSPIGHIYFDQISVE